MDAACRLQLGEAVGNIIPETISQNLEITRTTMFGGMGAQLINNRRFYAAASESFARGWKPI